ncbi:DUF1223 domain-containing protein [Edaphobacter albus]|uniref:DUF1223 domain-containing protein n=1 Tax=Edaphobacter sp. 4G125 TaxID=2763071 RepID=UPI001645D888|nr:DUF1223 domain-containing protein [Edaphobacter sp. 4G125]QNI35559.1 DUF1223 domain-containing protein [Edaphobacter sp. 4G125]
MNPYRFASALLLLIPFSLTAQTKTSDSRTPVLVELFTSEGCSSCPSADKLLAALQSQQPVAGAHIIVLEEHVDYWDQQGWHDRFSSPQFTERQKVYAFRLKVDDPYTPEMIVDGVTQFSGNDPAKAVSAITQAAQSPKIDLVLSKPSIEGKRISSSVSVASEASTLPKGDLYAALVTPSASTQVKSGENGGKHLDHVSVTRTLQHIGKLQDLGHAPIAFKLSAPPDDDPAHMQLIIFAQLPGQGAVRGLVQINAVPAS